MQDVVRGKTRDGVVSFTPPCYYHYRVRTCERAATPSGRRPSVRASGRGSVSRANAGLHARCHAGAQPRTRGLKQRCCAA